MPKKVSLPGSTLFAMGLASGTAGGLVLGGILNIGLLSGAGGSLIAGLTVAAACTGFGLIIVGAALIAIGAYLLINMCKEYKNMQQDETRLQIYDFLNNNITPIVDTTEQTNHNFFSRRESNDPIQERLIPLKPEV